MFIGFTLGLLLFSVIIITDSAKYPQQRDVALHNPIEIDENPLGKPGSDLPVSERDDEVDFEVDFLYI